MIHRIKGKQMGFIKKSKITLFLENDKYLPGSQIKGSVSLSLNKPLKAKSLKVYLISQKIIRQRMPKFGIGGFKARNSRINEAKYIFSNQSFSWRERKSIVTRVILLR